jgi:hypothetical protein
MSSCSNHSNSTTPKMEKKKSHSKGHTPSDHYNHSMLAKLQPNLNVRRKSSPAIHDLASLHFGLHEAEQQQHQSTSSGQHHNSAGVRRRTNHHAGEQLYAPSASQLATRRLSSPPSLDKETLAFNYQGHAYGGVRKKSYDDCDRDRDRDRDRDGSGSSSGSLHKWEISGLRPSSSSGHQVRQMCFSYFANQASFCVLHWKVVVFHAPFSHQTFLLPANC